MSFQMPISKRKITHHFQYAVWMYLVLIALALFGWNLIYTTTRYRPPESKQIEFYVQANSADDTALNTLADKIHKEVMPDMELVSATVVNITGDYYGDMQLTVWISAAQGDLYLMTKDYFQSFAASGAFMDLQPQIENGLLNTDGLDLTGGYVAQRDADTGEAIGVAGLYGIPADSLTGFAEYQVSTDDMVLCILYNNGNDENSVKFLNYLLENLR